MTARLRRLAEAIVIALFGAMVIVFAANIVGRFGFNRPIIWADEVLVLLMIWCTFLTGAFVLRERDHVVFDLIYERFAPAGRRRVAIAGSIGLVAILLAAMPGMLGYIAFLWRERTNVLEIRLDIAYSCFGIFLIAVVVGRSMLLFRLWRADWPRALAETENPPPGGA